MIHHPWFERDGLGPFRVRGRRTTRAAPASSRLKPRVEWLEDRELLATVAVNAGQVVRSVDTQLLGVNLAWWDSDLNTSETQQMVESAGLTMFRFPGGSSADDFHFNAPPTYDGEGTDASMASFIASVNGVGMATVDYGSGSPQEAAAFLAYLTAPVGNTTPIGNGPEWNDSAGAWQTVNWQTAGDWAGLRAAAPLAVDDGLNFLRLDHPAPFDVPYWEVGNEEYGYWEIDHHTVEHDPATYITFARQFAGYAAQIDPSISIGLDVGSPGDDNNWTANILQQSSIQGFMPGFLSDHNYVQEPGSESDSNLLLATVSDTGSDPSDPGNPYDWAVRAADYDSMLTQYLGAAGENVQLLATEFNSVSYNPGKQTTSLVNGLFVADSIGALLETPYEGADVWDLRNGYTSGNNDSSGLYGWRQEGDYGLIGSPGDGSAPATGEYVPYPTYFAEQLASEIVQPGGSVVQASSSDPNLSVYAVLESSGHLDLLVINKSATSALTGRFQLNGFTPPTLAQVWQYGEAQDTAQSQTDDGQSALTNFTASLNPSGSTFSYSFPAYSMTVLDLDQVVSITSGPTITQAAAGSPSVVTGTTTALSVSATDPAGASSLTYTWMTTGTPPAPVRLGANGTNAAQDVTATFTKAGVYSFQVTVSDPSGGAATSSLTVTVDPTLTTIGVSPGSSVLAPGGQEAFEATAYDQFGDPISPGPSVSWSLAQGIGTIDPASGVYLAPDSSGTATIRASSGGISGTASLSVSSPPIAIVSPTVISPPLAFVASVAFAVVSAGQAGFQASMTIADTGSTAIDNWTLRFRLAARIRTISDARIVRHSGKFYVIENADGDGTIAPGQSVSFGFGGRPGRVPKAPTDVTLNGIAIRQSVATSATARVHGRRARAIPDSVSATPRKGP
jgi:hypothetical protein